MSVIEEEMLGVNSQTNDSVIDSVLKNLRMDLFILTCIS
jgi:hypothetical protein